MKYTSSYWLKENEQAAIDDTDAERFIKIFTFLDKETIDNLIEEHNKARHLFLLQKTLAKELTIMVHGEEEFSIN